MPSANSMFVARRNMRHLKCWCRDSQLTRQRSHQDAALDDGFAATCRTPPSARIRRRIEQTGALRQHEERWLMASQGLLLEHLLQRNAQTLEQKTGILEVADQSQIEHDP